MQIIGTFLQDQRKVEIKYQKIKNKEQEKRKKLQILHKVSQILSAKKN